VTLNAVLKNALPVTDRLQNIPKAARCERKFRGRDRQMYRQCSASETSRILWSSPSRACRAWLAAASKHVARW